MKLLLDTHTALWVIDKPALLSAKARKAILNDSNEIFVSVASLWELELKIQAGKLTLPNSAPVFLGEHLRSVGVTTYLPIGLFHIHQLSRLPLIHKDPFDRMLIAQAIAEGLTLVTKDEIVRRYPLATYW
jgi:PIN domain nuclease of toxin-antitoxin system